MDRVYDAVIGPVVDSIMDPIKRHLGYLISSTENVKNMSKKRKQLDDASNDVTKHVQGYKRRRLEIPTRVEGWLKDVEKINEDVPNISSNENEWLNIIKRYQAGREAADFTDRIEGLITEKSTFDWIEVKIPPALVEPNQASTSTTSWGDTQNRFKSRDKAFQDALKFLQQDDHNARVIALCGMGGVGKTTMMEELKKVANDKKIFDFIVKVVIGRDRSMFSVQNAIAHSITTENIPEASERADHLCKIFEKASESKKKILVILDDVWEAFDLRDIGLSTLPNGVKLLLTSRHEHICREIAIGKKFKAAQVKVLEQSEALNLLCQMTSVSLKDDPDLYQIGGEIVKECGHLPLAIKVLSPILQVKEEHLWKATLLRLKKNDLTRYEKVYEAIDVSYKHIKDEEDKSIFLLCGLFPEDSDIPIEDLTRYAWGLRDSHLLKGISTFSEARDITRACVSKLKDSHLLMESDDTGCVKMHDLVLGFVLDSVLKGSDHGCIINHGDTYEWSTVEMRESCRRISLTCRGMSKFPIDFKCPNLSLLKLMHGDDSLEFPENFHCEMAKLEVLAYESMKCSWLARSLQYSINLRTLCLYECFSEFDCSPIGDHLNLEVLSFVHCGIEMLPSTIGNLEQLRLLDVTGCRGLRIHESVLKKLVKLEELYMRVDDRKAISFTDENRNELAHCSKNLSALEVEFFETNAQLKNMSFGQLERFKISVGCFLNDEFKESKHSFENTLMLATNKGEILDSRIYVLFKKTKVLSLQKVDGMNRLEDIDQVESLRTSKHSSFHNLKVLVVSECAELSHLFTVHVATALSKLEHLEVSECHVMETLILSDNNNVAETITFPELKIISLKNLPKLWGLCNTFKAIKLPELLELRVEGLPTFISIYELPASSALGGSLVSKEVRIPKLEKLWIVDMENLKEIWPREFSSSEKVNLCVLRKIEVRGCNSLVNLFPSNPMPFLHHLEELSVEKCGSIRVLFNIDLECVGEIDEFRSSLRRINVDGLKELRVLWRIKGANNDALVIHAFQAVEWLHIENCRRFRSVFTPTTIIFDLGAIQKINIWRCGESVRNNELVESIREEQEISVRDDIFRVVFPSYVIHTIHNLHELTMWDCKGVEVVFEKESREMVTTPNNQQQPLLLLPNLTEIKLSYMESMSHVWKCNWNEFLILKKQHPQSPFHNLTTIYMLSCKSIKYLFSPLMAQLFVSLKEVYIRGCDGVEEVVSNRDDEDEVAASTSTHTLFPNLDSLNFHGLENLKCIGGGVFKCGGNDISLNKISDVGVVNWSLCQYSRKIVIWDCPALSSVIPSYAVGQMQKLEELKILSCRTMSEVFETQGINNNDEGSDDMCTTLTVPRPKHINVPQLSNLKTLSITHCDLLQHVFTFSTLESLKQLNKLWIARCEAMDVIVKEEDGEQTTTSKVVVFPRLKSIGLVDLPNLAGFFLGTNDFQFPLLDDVTIDNCPKMIVFTTGI